LLPLLHSTVVLVTTSAAKLLEDQEPEARFMAAWHWQSQQFWSWFAFKSFNG